MWPLPDTVAILGQGAAPVSLALRKVLRFKECRGPVVVFDALGRGAAVLDEELLASLGRRPVRWYDIADRRRPLGLFSLSRTSSTRTLLTEVLATIRAVARSRVSDGTLSWAATAGARLAEDGPIGLGALLRSLGSPQVRRWFIDTQPRPAELATFLEMLRWALRFPAVCALCEAPHRVSLAETFATAETVWIEAKLEHFEPAEHRIATAMILSILANEAHRFADHGGNSGGAQRPMIVQLFPPRGDASAMPTWVGRSAGVIRHLAAFQLWPQRPPEPYSKAWATGASNVWVTKPSRSLELNAHRSWAEAKDIERINALKQDQLWIRENHGGRAIVARSSSKVRVPRGVHALRYEASRRRPQSRHAQLSSLAEQMAPGLDGEIGLYERMCDRDLLRTAWFRVKQSARSDSRGVDNVTVKQFGTQLDKELDSLAADLTARRYRCQPLRRTYIPKPDGGRRPLGICCVRDRVAQATCLLVLDPVFEPTFSHFSFAFRMRRNAHQAVAVARSMIAAGRTWAVTADIRKCFDTIDHEVLVRLLSERISDRALLNIIRHWLTVDVLDFHELLPTEIGVPQGEVLSPLLANIYLDPLDRHLERLGLDFVRYADDIVIFATGEDGAKTALLKLGDFLADPLHLQLKPSKTQCVPVADGVGFLGFTLYPDHLSVQPSRLDRALDKVRSQVRLLGSTHATFMQQSEALVRLNALVRGFRNYFLVDEAPAITQQLLLLDGRVEQMAQRLLPARLRDDPAWICRERFDGSGACSDRTGEAQRTESDRQGYPEERPQPEPASWHTKAELAPRGEAACRGEADGPKAAVSQRCDPREHSFVYQQGRLFVLMHGSYLNIDDGQVVIKRRKEELWRVPMEQLRLVYLQGLGMNISVQLQIEFAERDIPVVFAPPVGQPVAFLTPIHSHRAHLRGLQVLRREDPDIIGAGLSMLAAKVGNQAAVLRYFAKYRKRTAQPLAAALNGAADSIRELANMLSSMSPDRQNVRAVAMGYEGRAAAIYWQQLIRLIPTGLAFGGRIQQSATDPVNQSVNYVYGILYGEVWRGIVTAGLDPYFGLMHGSQRDQGSLVFDLIEEFRAPFADRVVLALLGRGFKPEVSREHRLRTRTRHQLATAFSKRWHKPIAWRSTRVSPYEVLTRQAQSLVKLLRRSDRYRPFKMRW